MIIGITGKSGSGKSYLSEILKQELDAEHIDIDKISHQILSEPDSIEFLKTNFPADIFENNVINRKKLGNIVFKNKKKLTLLNTFAKNKIENKLDKILESTNKSIILDYALLCGLKQFESCSIKILLNNDFETRFERVSKKENISKEYFLSRDKNVNGFENFKFDFIFNNISNEQIKTLINTLKQKQELL